MVSEPSIMEDRVRKLEAAMMELNSKVDKQAQATQDSVASLSTQVNNLSTEFGSFKEELLQLLILNRPSAPIIGNSPGQSSAHGQFPREPSLAPERPAGRPDKAPMQEAEIEEVDPGSETPRGVGQMGMANEEWAPRIGGMDAWSHGWNQTVCSWPESDSSPGLLLEV